MAPDRFAWETPWERSIAAANTFTNTQNQPLSNFHRHPNRQLCLRVESVMLSSCRQRQSRTILSSHQDKGVKMANSVKPVPEGFHAVTPALVVRDAAKAIDFYKKPLAAQELMPK